MSTLLQLRSSSCLQLNRRSVAVPPISGSAFQPLSLPKLDQWQLHVGVACVTKACRQVHSVGSSCARKTKNKATRSRVPKNGRFLECLSYTPR
jgi:hypothetical protein